jgi:lysophospholipase L1-like esterase
MGGASKGGRPPAFWKSPNWIQPAFCRDRLGSLSEQRFSMTMFPRLNRLFALIGTVGLLQADLPADPVAFPTRARWLAVGDSITAWGPYAQYFELFQVLRLGEDAGVYSNAAVSGDTAAGAVERFSWSIVPPGHPLPTLAAIMFGMNDCGRDLYGLSREDNADMQAERDARIQSYSRNLTTLVDQLTKAGVRVVLVTPSPYDDTSLADIPNSPGVNSALARCSDVVRRLANERGLGLIDFHGPLTALRDRIQEANPRATPLGGDRVHPGEDMHFAMTYELVSSQFNVGPFSKVVLNAATVEVREARGAGVTNLTQDAAGTFRFSYLASALPYPEIPAVKVARIWVPFDSEFNREELRIVNLRSGLYRVSIDGAEVLRVPSVDLGRGINLAAYDTPQMLQAVRVREILERRWEAVSQLRLLIEVEHWRSRDLPQPPTPETIEFALSRWEQELSEHPQGWQANHPANYRKWKPMESDLRRTAETLSHEAKQEALPKPRAFVIERID